jgi:S1-C subfamily serine protease
MTGCRRTSLVPGLVLAALVLAPAGTAQQRATAPTPDADRAWMGVFLGDAVDGGVYLIAVVPGGPADRAGLQVGDIVVQADEFRLAGVGDLSGLLERSRPGTSLELQLLRSGAPARRVVALAGRPPSPALVSAIALAPPAVAAAGAGRAYGLLLADLTPDLRRYYGAPGDAGVLVTGIEPGRPAADDGFRVGDLLIRLDGEPVRGVVQAERLLRSPRAEQVAASLIRERRAEVLTLTAPTSEGDSVPEWAVGDAAADGAGGTAARAALDRALRQEIVRLEVRIEKLKHRLGELEDEPQP